MLFSLKYKVFLLSKTLLRFLSYFIMFIHVEF